MSAHDVLDRVQSLARIAELEADPHVYADRVAAELTPAETRDELAARDDQLRDALARIETMVERTMRIRLDHALADDTSIAAPTRKVFASTVASYGDKLGVLEARARDAATRGGSADPARAAARVVEAASATLELRGAIRGGVLALIAGLATTSLELADRTARDRRLEDPPRRAWSAMRRELEAVATRPARIADDAMAARLATWPEQIDEPDPADEPTFADMIELD